MPFAALRLCVQDGHLVCKHPSHTCHSLQSRYCEYFVYQPKSTAHFLQQDQRIRDSTVLPSTSADFCIIHEGSGAFIAQPTTHGDEKKRKITKIERVIHALIAHDGILLCLIESSRSTTLSTYSVNSKDDGSIVLKSKIKMEKKVSQFAKMALQIVRDRPELVVCCPEKGIFRYSFCDHLDWIPIMLLNGKQNGKENSLQLPFTLYCGTGTPLDCRCHSA